MVDGLICSERADRCRQRGRVLVAEGDPVSRGLIVNALMRAGVSSVEAATHQIALERLWTDPFIDVIIAALRLPGGSGTRLVDAAHAALGRDFEAIILAPPGAVIGYSSIEGANVMTVVHAATNGLDEVAARRLRGGGARVALPPSLEAVPETLFECLAVAAEHKDNETGRHNRRIGLYAKVVVEVLGWSPERQAVIEIAATLHDIGKIGIPDSILFKPGSLTEDEVQVMQRHTIIGHTILSAARNPLLACAASIAQHHHEQWCGGGYPHGLSGRDIPVEARVVTICDVYDALRSERPYKSARSHQEALSVILAGDDRTHISHFDPEMLALMTVVEASFERIFAAMTGP